MLTYFSSTIRQQCIGDAATHTYILQPRRIYLSKGSPQAVADVFNWMQTCCNTGHLCLLSEVILSPSRYLLALSAARQLDVQLLEYEIHLCAFRLQTELLTTDQIAAVASDMTSLHKEIQDAVVGNIARCFITGRLPNVRQYLELATAQEQFHKALSNALRSLKECEWHPFAGEAENAWLRKEELEVAPKQAVPSNMRTIPAPPTFVHTAIPAQDLRTQIPPPPPSVLSLCGGAYTGDSWIDSPAYTATQHHTRSIHHEYQDQFEHPCPKTRHEECDALTCNQKTVSDSDMVARARARYPPMAKYLAPASAIDTPHDEAPTPDETLLERRCVSDGHYLHIFRDARGGRRYVSKGPGFRFETDVGKRMLKYGCGCWLDAPARRWFGDDGSSVGSSARYTCDSCIRGGGRPSRVC